MKIVIDMTAALMPADPNMTIEGDERLLCLLEAELAKLVDSKGEEFPVLNEIYMELPQSND